MKLLSRSPLTLVFLAASCAALFLLWLPGLKYPVVEDTSVYGMAGQSFWRHGTYEVLGVPFRKHLPFQAVVSYPLTEMFGISVGMKVSTLLAGFAILWMTFLLLKRAFSKEVAVLSVIAVLLNHGFVLMTQLGSADLLFTFLFLSSAYCFLRAEEDERWYVPWGIACGCLCLTRYNGIPVVPVFVLWALIARAPHRRSGWFWGGLCAAIGLTSIWFIRNFFTFGNPFATDYTVELGAEAPNHFSQLLSNTVYYLNPIHNILPLLLLFAFYGLWRFWKGRVLLILLMGSAWALTAIWWVQAIRFAFPAYPILIGFACAGIVDLFHRVRFPKSYAVTVASLFVILHLPALCVYAYGECNALFDKKIGLLPGNLHLTPEGFYAWHLAREYFDAHAETGAVIDVEQDFNAEVWKTGVFRPDIQVKYGKDACPGYRITQDVHADETVLFTTDVEPKTSVVRKGC